MLQRYRRAPLRSNWTNYRKDESQRLSVAEASLEMNRDAMTPPHYPSLYQINTRAWLTGLSRTLGRPVTLDDIPDAGLDRLAQVGFDRIGFLSVWQTGPAGRRVARQRRLVQGI